MEASRPEERTPWWLRAGFTLGVALLLVQVVSCLPPVRSALGDDWPGDLVLQDTLYPLAALLVLARAVRRRRERSAWLLLGIGLVSYSIGNAYYEGVVSGLDPEPAVTLADPLLLALYPCLYATLVRLLRSRQPRLTTSAWLDGLIAVCFGAAFSSLPLLNMFANHPHESLVALASYMAYPASDMILAGCLFGAWALTGWRAERVWLLLIVGMLLFGVADVVSMANVLEQEHFLTHWLDTSWLLGVAAMVAAAWYPERERGPRVATKALAATGLPALFACACLGLLLHGALSQGALPAVTSILAGLAVSAVVVRMLLTVRAVEALADARRQARTDDLTELPNRRLFLESVDSALAGRDQSAPMSVAIVDLDRFKEVNDSFGHHVGDRLIQLFAERLAATLPPSALLARLGGDEFGVLLPGADAGRAQEFGAAVLVALERPFSLDGTTLHIDASIGLAMYPADGTDRASLLRHADTAMYQAKSTHSGYALAAGQRDDEATRRSLDTLEQLREGLDRDELVLHYQPQVDISSGRVVGVEALVRWDHPIRGLVYPDAFIPLAERAGMMGRLTMQVLELALVQCARWRDAGLSIAVAVNLSASNLRDASLPERVAEALARHLVPASSLHLEVTEDVIMQDAERARQLLASLRALGIRLAIDDYGTGYSSLAYLQTLAVDDLKLDRAFVSHCDCDSRSAAIVASTVDLAHNLGLRLIAEGVENEAVLDRLRGFGCDVAQGYFLARPQNPESLTPWLIRQEAARPAMT